MLIVDVEYLMGRVVASSYSDRSTVEYPPHPSRLFSAFVAAYKDNDLGIDARKSLEWLETLGDPSLFIDAFNPHELGKTQVTYFVPVNDSPSAKDRKSVQSYRKQPSISPGIGVNRLRAERNFPSIAPADRHVRFIWNVGEECDTYIPGLRSIAERITYLGHSSSPVAVRVTTGDLTPNIVPKQNGLFSLRSIGQGRLKYLEQLHTLRQRNPGIQPRAGRIVRYGLAGSKTDEKITGRVPGYSFTFKLNSHEIIPGTAFHRFIDAARSAILSLYPDPIPEIISGHQQDGSPLKAPHLSVVPHIDMGHSFARGHLMGFSLILPDSADPEVRTALGAAAAKLYDLKLGRLGSFQVQLIEPDLIQYFPIGLDLSHYEGSSKVWATVTPIVLGKHPKPSSLGPGRNGGPVFKEACLMAGIPQPEEIIPMSTSVFEGVALSRDFAVPQKFRKYLRMHAILRFRESLNGPAIVGSGRFSGFGLLHPFSGGY